MVSETAHNVNILLTREYIKIHIFYLIFIFDLYDVYCFIVFFVDGRFRIFFAIYTYYIYTYIFIHNLKIVRFFFFVILCEPSKVFYFSDWNQFKRTLFYFIGFQFYLRKCYLYNILFQYYEYNFNLSIRGVSLEKIKKNKSKLAKLK